MAEPVARFAVELLGDPRRAVEQGLRGGHIELRVLAQKGEEGGQIALKMHLLHHRHHLGADMGDFFQPDLVDLFGGRSSVVNSRIWA